MPSWLRWWYKKLENSCDETAMNEKDFRMSKSFPGSFCQARQPLQPMESQEKISALPLFLDCERNP